MAKQLIILTIIAFLLLPFLCYSFNPENPTTNPKILVLLDDFLIKSSHSIFFNSLQSRGFKLDFKLADDNQITLQRYGNYLYDGLILFSPSIKQFGGSLNLAGVLEFVDSGRDLIVAADSSASDLIRDIATECGVEFDENADAMVIDHTSYAVSDVEGDHTLIASDEFIQSDVILGSKKIEAPVLFKGIGHTLNPANSLVNLNDFLLTFFRSRVHKARSSNKHGKSGNELFVTELSKWVFHEKGHLKAVNVRHHKVEDGAEPAMYRIKDDLEYFIEIYEWTGKSWEPYVANDVQVQFYMMSPYVLKNLSTDQKGLYFTSFKVPDIYGVFQFKVEYHRLGYTSLSLSKQIPVRPFRHNEYERFLPAAFPYYGASFSTMAGFFVFTFIYLYNK
ncbi:Dolichyl-diphosphooligosaccharide--protein glycosyltransferase subunit [Thalictrum thalictroides]|uniref:Dolichyl-diphosphooligosaccharide--protein glycosyltransferase 48 kDa subunit n=1 Tax=Thalictrum thalictroides TaxID=46969 RepID=A0A7J6V3U9_THATH|nr:Dolichyl-diphosphooligosaccharide--protein glycosyltransferase subunit [Thalictrum thalictroides]